MQWRATLIAARSFTGPLSLYWMAVESAHCPMQLNMATLLNTFDFGPLRELLDGVMSAKPNSSREHACCVHEQVFLLPHNTVFD